MSFHCLVLGRSHGLYREGSVCSKIGQVFFFLQIAEAIVLNLNNMFSNNPYSIHHMKELHDIILCLTECGLPQIEQSNRRVITKV